MKAAKKLHENQARVEQLTKDWTEKWKEAKSIMQVGRVGEALCITGKTSSYWYISCLVHNLLLHIFQVFASGCVCVFS